MIKEDIKALLEYNWKDEEKSYEECDKPKDHIFLVIKRIDEWLESPYCPLIDEDELGEENE